MIVPAVVSYRAVESFAASRHAVIHAYEVLDHLDGVDNALDDAETGQRGFLLTGDEAYLESYPLSLASLAEHRQGVDSFARENPLQQGAITELGRLVSLRLQYIEDNIDHARAGLGYDKPRLMNGLRTMNQIRASIAALKADEQRELQERLLEVDERVAWTKMLIVAGNLTGLVLLVVVCGLLLREVAERRRSQGTANDLNADLLGRSGQLEVANRDLEGFSYSVSHDLRSPLRAIGGYAQMLEEDYGERLDDEGRRLLGVVRKNAGQMGQLIDDLLSFSRFGRTAIASASINMDGLISEVVQQLSAEFPKVQWQIGTVPPAVGDYALLRQVWRNLLGNACKYSGTRDAPRIEIDGTTVNGESVYRITDNGVGFDMRYQHKLFGVFQRLHGAEEFPGTGVGLAIVHRLVTRHGGRVWAEGEPGVGASFHFSLPIT